jgi:hypothetical protein
MFIDEVNNSFSIESADIGIVDVFIQIELNVALFKVVIMNLN